MCDLGFPCGRPECPEGRSVRPAWHLCACGRDPWSIDHVLTLECRTPLVATSGHGAGYCETCSATEARPIYHTD
jgi:hypothetical protein